MGACKNSVEWLGVTRLAIEDLIHKWKLPKSTLPSKDKVWIRIEEKKTTDAQQFLMLEDTATGGRVSFIVDCQTLSDITCGQLPINSKTYEPICERITNNLFQIMRNGQTFAKPSRPVVWRPRSFNQLADELANKAMDTEMDLEWECEVGVSWANKDILIFSDGGFRSKGNSASAAWVVIDKPTIPSCTNGQHGTAHIIAKGAIFLSDGCTSSFMAEAIALEKATLMVKNRRSGRSCSACGIPFNFEAAAYREVVRS